MIKNWRKRVIFVTALLIVTVLGNVALDKLYVVPIVTYHSINHEINLLTVSPEVFKKQMEAFKRDYEVISFDQYVKNHQAKKQFKRNTLVIHFDDGLEDNYSHGFEVIKNTQLPVTIFLISDLVGKDKNYLTWEQVKEMQQNGVSFGSHTRTHAYLPEISLEQAKEEIEGSKKILEEKLGVPVKHFVYPIGGMNEQVRQLVINAGYEAAATTNQGPDRFNRDLFSLNRVRLKDSDLGFKLKVKLSGYYNLFRRVGY